MDDEAPAVEESAGAPAWVMTFADLMSLLMCFFVLMLAFSEMDAQRFKLLAGSMRDAFGVQAEIEAKMRPRGTSLITKEFAPGRPQPTPMQTVRQFTVNSNRNTLDIIDMDKREREKLRRLAEDTKTVRRALDKDIQAGKVGVDVEGVRIIVRINEQASFDSGSAQLKESFTPVLGRIGALLGEIPGEVTVSGHTDDVPIGTARFRSNWDLSAARAVSVTHELVDSGGLSPERFVITGHADTRPRAPNDSPANRSLNRRVEISVVRDSGGDEERVQQVQTALGTEDG